MSEDLIRKIIDLSLAAAKKKVSTQTQLVHFFPDAPFMTQHDTIPIFENMCYVLGLFRSRLVDNIHLGKELLHKLLSFEVEGNFPVFLHEYPHCKDRNLSAHLLPVFFYLQKEFSSVLGELLSKRLQECLERVFFHLDRFSAEISSLAKMKKEAFLQKADLSSWHPSSPVEWAEYWLCFQMQPTFHKETIPFWNKDCFVYIGPAKERMQERFEPAVTLLDLYMGVYFGSFSARSLQDHPCHLKASLLYPFSEGIKIVAESGKSVLLELEHRQRVTLYWGERSHTHSLVLEAKHGSFAVEKIEGVYHFHYTYDTQIPDEEDRMEVALYIDASIANHLRINESKASVFHLQDMVKVESDGISIELIFVREEGIKGMGHLSKANRSFQRCKESYTSFDWKIGWRTIRREANASLHFTLRLT